MRPASTDHPHQEPDEVPTNQTNNPDSAAESAEPIRFEEVEPSYLARAAATCQTS